MGLAARVAVGVVLLVAGAAKLGQATWSASAAAFGTPARLVPAVPWLELALGAALMAGVAMPWPAWAALVLLGTFTVAVARHVRRGDRPPCGCFGEAVPTPVGPATLARNLVLCLLAVAAALDVGGGRGAGPALAGVALGAAVVAAARAPGTT